MTISAKVLLRSRAWDAGCAAEDLLTFELRYPRFIHAEFMTHRVFSRNASSSRAVPVKRAIREILRDMAVPIHFGRNERGMQASAELTGWRRAVVRNLWCGAGYAAVGFAWLADKCGAHKQVVNRIMEPWSHIKVVVTSSEWTNFYALRRHKDAQPEMQALADAMWEASKDSIPQLLKPGEWHLPYVSPQELREIIVEYRADWPWLARGEDFLHMWAIGRKLSVARCARVTHLTHDGKVPVIKNDLGLYDRLVGAEPLHASPCEHQARPDRNVGNEVDGDRWAEPELHGNLVGWVQNRKIIERKFKERHRGRGRKSLESFVQQS